MQVECLGVPLHTVKKYNASMKENNEKKHLSPVLKKKQRLSDGERSLIKFDEVTLIRRTIFLLNEQNRTEGNRQNARFP